MFTCCTFICFKLYSIQNISRDSNILKVIYIKLLVFPIITYYICHDKCNICATVLMVWKVGITLPSTHTVSTSPKHMLPWEVITTNNCVNRMTRLEVNEGKCAGGDSIRAGGRCGSGQSVRLLLCHRNNLHQTSLPASLTLRTVLRWIPHLQLHLKDDLHFTMLAATYAISHTMPTRTRNVKSTFLLQFQHPYFIYKVQRANLQFVAGLTPCRSVS